MNIAIDAYHALFSSGGIARYTRSLVNALSPMAAADRIILFYNRFRTIEKTWRPVDGNTIIRQAVFPRRLLQKAWHRLSWPSIEFFCDSVDIFHGLHFVLPPARNARRILTVHDLTYFKFPSYYNDQKLNLKGYTQELPRALELSDAVIAVSSKTREDLIEHLNYPELRVRVIHEGVDHQLFRPISRVQAEPIQQSYGLGKPYLIFLVGTPEPRKNLLRTVQAVQKAAPKMTLALVGPRDRLEKMLVGRNRNLTFTGPVAEQHLPALLSGASISLYPSLYEGFGLPVLEAMACGVPVITSNRGALPEIAGNAAVLVEPEDTEAIAAAIREILDGGRLRTHLIALGQKRAAEFTWQKTAEQTMSLYRELA